jgi:hypothetical protein
MRLTADEPPLQLHQGVDSQIAPVQQLLADVRVICESDKWTDIPDRQLRVDTPHRASVLMLARRSRS